MIIVKLLLIRAARAKGIALQKTIISLPLTMYEALFSGQCFLHFMKRVIIPHIMLTNWIFYENKFICKKVSFLSIFHVICFSNRYEVERVGATKRNKGLEKMIQQKKADAFFHTSDEFVAAFENYLTDCEADFKTKPPSFARFAEYLNVSRKSVFTYLDKFAEADRVIRQMLADAIVENAMTGAYRDAVAIFALKNRCNWADKKETTNTTRGARPIATPDEARENVRRIMSSLGYDDKGNETAASRKNMEDLEGRVIQLAEAKAE